MRGDSWSASLWTVPEHQCIPHPADYGPNFSQLVMWKDVDPVTKEVDRVAHGDVVDEPRAHDLDGRSSSPARVGAPHVAGLFDRQVGRRHADGRNDAPQAGLYLRRNGLARSEKATVREHFIRNGDILTIVTIVNDPVYLTEPYIKTRNFQIEPGYQMTTYPCSIDVEIDRPAGEIPHYLPGANPFISEAAAKHKMPLEAARGGAETMYPEYMVKMKTMPTATMPPRRRLGCGQRPTAGRQACGGTAPAAPHGRRDETTCSRWLATATMRTRGVDGSCAQTHGPPAARRRCRRRVVHIWPVQRNIYACSSGRGGNATVSIGDEGVLVVDTMTGRGRTGSSSAPFDRCRQQTDPVDHQHPQPSDHTGGNATLVARSGGYIAGGNTRGGGGASIVAFENALMR